MTEETPLGEVAYAAFGAFIVGENVTFGAGLPFDALPPEVQVGFRDAADAVAARRAGPPTVTVTTFTGPDQQWEADGIGCTEGTLVIGTPDMTATAPLLKPVALYAPGQWQYAGMDGHRAEAGPDLAAQVAGLEAELKVVLNIATVRDTIGGADALEAIRERVARVLREMPDAAS
jgi:hypothetical protein